MTAMNHLRVGSVNVAFEQRGSGAPLVLLHGGVSDRREWRRQLEDLSDEFTVVAWDAPGCGQSTDPPEHFSLSDYARCLAELIETLVLGRPHVAGLSFGGTLALELYRQRPDLPRTLILASAYTGWAGSLPPEVVTERLQSVTRDSSGPPEEFAARWLPTLLTKGAPAALIDELRGIIIDFHPVGARTMARAMARADLRDVLPKIDIPTLLLYGEADVRSAPTVAEELQARIPDSTLIVLPQVGHQINMEAADQFNSALRDFLHQHNEWR